MQHPVPKSVINVQQWLYRSTTEYTTSQEEENELQILPSWRNITMELQLFFYDLCNPYLQTKGKRKGQ